MEIIFDDATKLCEIQEEFSKHFPFLKLQFFGFELKKEKVFLKKNLITDINKTLGEVRHVHLPGHVTIHDHLKVNALERYFRENYGINIQVFRKSGNNWLETTTTDNWTLSEQNKKGKEMNASIEKPAIDDYDQYHEQL